MGIFSISPRKVPRVVFWDAGARMPRKSLYMHFVDDRLRRGPSERNVSFPVVQAWIDDHAFHRRRGIITFFLRRFARVVLGTATARPYGSSKTLVGSKRNPWEGSNGP